MPSVLIVADERLSEALKASPVWRQGVTRETVTSTSAAATAINKAKPTLVLLDRDMAGAEAFTRQIRSQHRFSIAIVAQGDVQGSEVGLLEAGANAVLRYPPGPEWEDRLARLLAVPARKQVRIQVDLEIEGLFESERVKARAQNLSRTGMLVECTHRLAVGEPLKFDLHLNSSTVLQGTARVVRQAAANVYGCEFQDLNDYDQRRLEFFLAAPG